MARRIVWREIILCLGGRGPKKSSSPSHTSSRLAGSLYMKDDFRGGYLQAKEKITALVRAAQEGDDLAFAELVCAYQDIAVAYATSILRDYHLAEDAAQEAFVEAYRELSALREPAAFAAWFRTIIFKHCDRMTRRKRHPVTGLDAALEVASPRTFAARDLGSCRKPGPPSGMRLRPCPKPSAQVVLLYYMGEHSHSGDRRIPGTSRPTRSRPGSIRRAND